MAADSLKIGSSMESNVGGGLSGSDLSLTSRRVEFHLSRKPFNGFSNGGGNFKLETLNPTSSNPQKPGPKPTKPGKLGDGSEGLDIGIDPELNFGFTPRRIGAGLANLGNTCFLNSVLQCLTYTEPLAAYLQSGKHQTSCRTAGFCALCAIQKHVSRALQSTGRILAPKEIVSNLRCISRNFRNSRQEDAHEYMVNLLESMHKCCLPSGVPSESPSAYDKSLVHKIFGGSLRSQVKCTQCSFSSNKFDPFLDLSLEIAKAESLHKALAHFTAKEQLDGGERHYQCQQCKQKVKALKQLTIHKAPYVLTIHLKRFDSQLAGQKINKKIHFGPTLDLKPFVTAPHDGELKYTLYGVLVHAGWSTHSGHYYCFVRTSSGMWYSLDDNQVVQVSERMVLEQKAYMLFYYRDKRNFASKKPLDVHKEDMTTNFMGSNNGYSKLNQELKECIQNGQVGTGVNDKMSFDAIGYRNSLTSALPLKTLVKDGYNQTLSGLTTAECTAQAPLKESLNDTSITNMRDEECSQQNDSSVKVFNVPPILENTKITIGSVKHGEFGLYGHCKNDAGNSVTGNDARNSGDILPNDIASGNPEKGHDNSVAVSPICSITRSSLDIKSTIDGSPGKNGVEATALNASARAVDPVMSLNPSNSEHSQGMVDVESAPTTKLISTQKDGGVKPNLRLKKKLPVCPIMKMQLSSKILVGTSLGVRRKHKRSKKRTSSRKHLVDEEGIPLDLGPSTSKRCKATVSCASFKYQRKGKKSSPKKKEKSCAVNDSVSNSNVLVSMSPTNNEHIERTTQNGAVLGVNNQSRKGTGAGPAGNQWDDGGGNSSKDSRRDSMQHGLMSMLTRGLEETIVSRWDEIDSYPSQMTETSGLNNSPIGYVGDQWDEEYDQGKRKRIRISKNDFGGSNPFQEIATMKAKFKKARLDNSSGNRPYRI